MRHSRQYRHNGYGRVVGVGLIITVILLGSTGVNCDSQARSTFRQEATGAIGSGVKTIMDGVLDGLVAAIEQAGDGSSSSSSSN